MPTLARCKLRTRGVDATKKQAESIVYSHHGSQAIGIGCRVQRWSYLIFKRRDAVRIIVRLFSLPAICSVTGVLPMCAP